MEQSKAVQSVKSTLNKRGGSISFRTYHELRGLITDGRRVSCDDLEQAVRKCVRKKDVTMDTKNGVITVSLRH